MGNEAQLADAWNAAPVSPECSNCALKSPQAVGPPTNDRLRNIPDIRLGWISEAATLKCFLIESELFLQFVGNCS